MAEKNNRRQQLKTKCEQIENHRVRMEAGLLSLAEILKLEGDDFAGFIFFLLDNYLKKDIKAIEDRRELIEERLMQVADIIKEENAILVGQVYQLVELMQEEKKIFFKFYENF